MGPGALDGAKLGGGGLGGGGLGGGGLGGGGLGGTVLSQSPFAAPGKSPRPGRARASKAVVAPSAEPFVTPGPAPSPGAPAAGAPAARTTKSAGAGTLASRPDTAGPVPGHRATAEVPAGVSLQGGVPAAAPPAAIAPPPPGIGFDDEAGRLAAAQRVHQGSLRGAAARSCRACGGVNGPAARFCQLCGAPLEGGSGERPRSRPPGLEGAPIVVPSADLVVIAQDGSPGRRYPLVSEVTTIGSRNADIALGKDPYVSPAHAELRFEQGRFVVVDKSSQNGVFVRIGGAVPLESGDRMLLGLGVLRFEALPEGERAPVAETRDGVRVFGTPSSPRYARLTVQTVEEKPRDVYYLSRAETVLGREVGDIVFTDDPFMSRRHAAIRRDPNTGRFTLRDLGSSNGSFVAIHGSHALSPGDFIRVGQHLFRLDLRSDR